jgi:uncharacterized protein YbjT (DUF2867 family)
MNSDTILVTGATGQQGGAVACHLLGRGFHVRALTRDPQKPGGRNLASRGAEVVQGNLDDPGSVKSAIEGAAGVFSVQTPSEAGVAREAEQGKMLADVAKAAGVRHFVYTSVGSANRNTGVPHFESKWQVEQHLRKIGIPYTIIRPVFFMQNWQHFLREPILNGTLPQPLDPDKPLQQVSVDDIGRIVARAFAKPDQWIGRELDLAGDELTMPQVAELFSRILDRPVTYHQVPWDEFHHQAGEEMTAMYRWFNDVGYQADIAGLRREFPWLATLEEVLRSEDWQAWMAEMPVGAGSH